MPISPTKILSQREIIHGMAYTHRNILGEPIKLMVKDYENVCYEIRKYTQVIHTGTGNRVKYMADPNKLDFPSSNTSIGKFKTLEDVYKYGQMLEQQINYQVNQKAKEAKYNERNRK